MKKLILALSFLVVLTGCNFDSSDYEMQLHPGNDIIEVGSEYVDAGCAFTINGKTYELKSTTETDTSEIGDYIITYATTVNGKNYQCKRVIKVIDSTLPTGTINPGVDTIHLNEEFVDAGVTAEDNYSEVTVTLVSNLDNTVTGHYTLLYEVSDESGNILLLQRVVSVIE